MARPGSNYDGAVPSEDEDFNDALEKPAPGEDDTDQIEMPLADPVEASEAPSDTVSSALEARPGPEQPGGQALARLDKGVDDAPTQYALVGASGDPGYLASLLPTRKSTPKMDFKGDCVLIYGPPKIGKSELASQFPTPFFIATEEGHSHLSIFRRSVTSWQHFLDIVQALIMYSDEGLPYETIVIDTVDLLFDMCLAHYTQEAGVRYPSDEAFGKGWDALKREWSKGIFALIKLGYTVVFVSHEKMRKVTLHSIERDVIGASLGATGRRVVMGSVDYIIYLAHAPEEETKDGRKMVLRGDSTIEAGDRSGFFPAMVPDISYASLIDAYVKYVVPGLQNKYGGKNNG
jgi:hypothetical protein